MEEIQSKKAKNIDVENLTLITDQYEVDIVINNVGEERLKNLGFTHDKDSIIHEDSFSAVFVGTKNGDYSEVWAFHNSFVKKNSIGYKLI